MIQKSGRQENGSKFKIGGAIGSSLPGIIKGIASIFGGGKNKKKSCCDYCTGEKIGEMMGGESCAIQFIGTAACDQFTEGGKLPEALKQKFLAANGLVACINRSGVQVSNLTTNVQSASMVGSIPNAVITGGGVLLGVSLFVSLVVRATKKSHR